MTHDEIARDHPTGTVIRVPSGFLYMLWRDEHGTPWMISYHELDDPRGDDLYSPEWYRRFACKDPLSSFLWGSIDLEVIEHVEAPTPADVRRL